MEVIDDNITNYFKDIIKSNILQYEKMPKDGGNYFPFLLFNFIYK